jgi:hypothetical protein
VTARPPAACCSDPSFFLFFNIFEDIGIFYVYRRPILG